MKIFIFIAYAVTAIVCFVPGIIYALATAIRDRFQHAPLEEPAYEITPEGKLRTTTLSREDSERLRGNRKPYRMTVS